MFDVPYNGLLFDILSILDGYWFCFDKDLTNRIPATSNRMFLENRRSTAM